MTLRPPRPPHDAAQPDPAADRPAPPWAALPGAVAPAVRPRLSAIVDEVMRSIAADVPAYRRPLEGTFGAGVRLGAEVALARFLELPGTSEPALRGDRTIYRQLGRGEFAQGRTLPALLAAYRVGARVAFRSFAACVREAGLPGDLLVPLAESLFAYIDELSAASVEGYTEQEYARAADRQRRRQELGALLLTGRADLAAARTTARLVGWTVPADLVAVVTTAEADDLGGRLGPDALVFDHEGERCALVPAPRSQVDRARLSRELAGCAAAVGPAVSWEAAAVSHRLASLAARLRDVLAAADGDGPIWSDVHLATLLVHRDPDLVARLAERVLAPLAAARPGTRERLAETLLSWLRHRGERTRMATELHVHPQTIGYRMSRVRELLGAALDDPEQRFALEVALRAGALRGAAPRDEAAARSAGRPGRRPGRVQAADELVQQVGEGRAARRRQVSERAGQ